MFHARLVQHRITSGNINIVADSHNLPAFWAHPQIGGPFPGLVLIHEWWGLTAHIRTQVRRCAELGFYVIAPDLFGGRIAQNADAGLALQQELGQAGQPRVAAALHALMTHHRCNGLIGLIGWQLGGELALHTALHRNDLRGVVTFYTKPDAYLDVLPTAEIPILAFYGEKDETADHLTINKMRMALAKSPGKGQVVTYPGATTGFFNDELPTYNDAAATDAWVRMIDFLCERLEINGDQPHKDMPAINVE